MNKNISSIQYNSLNLPSSINYQNGNMTGYVYSAAGGKLSVSYQTGTGNTSTQYCGNIIYDNNNLSQVLIDGGYITFSGTTPQYHYYLQDHLGSNRVVVNESGTAEQVNHYYPFGGIIADLSTGQDIQKYKYNGKELDRTHGLDWYDYGARQYYSILGRWDRMDPLCEKYYSLSPYNYCGNNPVNAIDEKGDSVCVLNLGNGTNQHLGMLIQNDKGTWSYYSFNGTSIYSSTSGSVGGAPHNNLGEKTFVSPMAFLNSQYNSDGSKGLIERDKINGYGYTEGYILPTSPKEDIVIRDNFVKTVNDGYDLIFNQCADAVKNALNSVGIDTSVFNYDVSIPLPGKNSHNIPLFSIKIEPYLPSKTFEAIRSNNSDGIYIKK